MLCAQFGGSLNYAVVIFDEFHVFLIEILFPTPNQLVCIVEMLIVWHVAIQSARNSRKQTPKKIVASNKEWIYSFVKTQVIFDGISSAAKTQVDSDQVREGLILPLLLLF